MTSESSSIADRIFADIEDILTEARKENRPLELDPYRGKLFEHFVTAERAGFLEEEAGRDLTADGICQTISTRWGLGETAKHAIASADRLSPEDLSQMRLLWSLMRMWMEWTYAWSRWSEFHPE